MESITIHADSLTAAFILLSVEKRIKELNQYHEKHPELPRQDDVLEIYTRAQRQLKTAGVEA